MKEAHFVDGEDRTTFFPFIMVEVGDAESITYRLAFGDWEWLQGRLGTDTIDGYYLNGTSVEALIKAARLEANLPVAEDRIEYNSEGDVCYMEFLRLEDACVTAELAQEVLSDKGRLQEAIARARSEDFDE